MHFVQGVKKKGSKCVLLTVCKYVHEMISCLVWIGSRNVRNDHTVVPYAPKNTTEMTSGQHIDSSPIL